MEIRHELSDSAYLVNESRACATEARAVFLNIAAGMTSYPHLPEPYAVPAVL